MPPESLERGEPRPARSPLVSVIVPARNEEACLGDCLRSLVAQVGVDLEIIVVDDGSTDRTREIAGSFAGVQVISAGELPAGWSGKCNAVWAGAQAAGGKWLLFTDADTEHLPGSLARSLQEARREGVALLSYSPEQEVRGLVQWTAMPAIFAELASVYPPRDVCDPASSAAAANGQYLLIAREAYDAVGGHQAVSSSLLEDLELAKLVKASGRRIRLRYGKGLVRTRMYRDTASLVEGWSKNLALLFPRTGGLAVERLAEFIAIVAGVVIGAWALTHRGDVAGSVSTRELVLGAVGIAVLAWLRVLKRVTRAHFGITAQTLAPLGLPIFSYLLLRSRFYYRWRRSVTWKGRAYCPSIPQSSSKNRSEPEETPVRGARWSI
ncbi:MAG: glycosyltransferase [Acidobacteriia bacterium]|nr:glycosyltransferase [Terriglobia bacterium]